MRRACSSFRGVRESAMCEESHGDDLTAVLRELDIAKAVMLQMQAQLNVALPALPQNADSEIYQAAWRRMNQAAERYRSAVKAFHAVCQGHALEESDRGRLQPVNP